MDRNSNADDVFGRLLFSDAYGQQSTAPTERMVPEMDAAHEDASQECTARIQDTYFNPRCDDVCEGCGSHSSLPHRMGREITNDPLVLEDIGQHDSQISPSTPEGDETTDRQQPGYRLLEQRDADGLSRTLSDAQGSRQNSDTFWLPFCARRTTSLLFMATFALMAATLEVLFTICQRNSGLSRDLPSIRYSWSYGTTGILRLTAAFWSRLDYETKVLAPWLRHYPITTSKTALAVDYVDAWSLLTPYRAFRNKDYEVAYSSFISLLLQVLIVISTALFTLAPTNLVDEAEPVFLTSRFVDDPARLKKSDFLLPYYITMGTDLDTYHNLSSIMRKNATYPEGCTNEFAYQTFYPASPTLEEVETTVDGLALRLECETADAVKLVRTSLSRDICFDVPGIYFEVQYQGCQTTIHQCVTEVYYRENNHISHYQFMALNGTSGFVRDHCNSTDQAHRRLVFMSVEVEWAWSNQRDLDEDGIYQTVGVIDATVSQAVALVCAPSLEQTLLDVSRGSGGVQDVSRHGDNPVDVLRLIQPWDFIDFFFDEDNFDLESLRKELIGNTTVWTDVQSKIVLAFCGQPCLEAPGILNDAAFLQDILVRFLTENAATTAHTMLTERVNITSTGTSSNIAVRLWVQPLVCHAMTALLALITLTILVFQFKHKKTLTRRVNPGSIAATAILAGQIASSIFPKELGAASAKDLLQTPGGFIANQASFSSYHVQRPPTVEEGGPERTTSDARPSSSGKPMFQKPFPLRPVSYIALILTIAACGTTLMILLRKSVDEKGLGDATASEYLLLAWTMVPATVLTVISWWISSIDTQVRLLAPYHLLKSNKCNRSVLRMDLLRGLVPIVLYQELKASNLTAVSTTLATLLGAILTTVSAAMFHVVTFPVSRPVEISSSTAFMSPFHPPLEDTATFSSRLPSLILETNLSYPEGSYKDLVFPEFFMKPLATVNASHKTNASSGVIKVTAPALRPRLSCLIYSPADVVAVYARNDSTYWGNRIIVNTTMRTCDVQVDEAYPYETAYFEFGTENLSEFTFGSTTFNTRAVPTTNIWESCGDMLYIWGYHDASPGPITNITAARCNNSEELVDVTFSLSETDLTLDLSEKPTTIESTVRDIDSLRFSGLFFQDALYNDLASLPTTNHTVFDPFFSQLVTSQYAIPVSAIGDPTQADIVMDAIRLHHGIIEAQFLNSNSRIDIDSATAMENASAVWIPTLSNLSTSDGTARYPAAVTYPFGSRRVVQDSTATAVLEALLLSILILVLLGWYLGPREPALPRSPSSVGSVLALLAGGNVLERLYDGGPEPQCWKDVKSRLGKDAKLYLGWNTVNGEEGDEQRRFGIWITDQARARAEQG